MLAAVARRPYGIVCVGGVEIIRAQIDFMKACRRESVIQDGGAVVDEGPEHERRSG